jgi:hypothetical protein
VADVERKLEEQVRGEKRVEEAFNDGVEKQGRILRR